MTKESRLSFRIDDSLSEIIDSYVDSNQNIRDRSDFGTQSIDYYFDLLQGNKSELLVIIESIIKLSKSTQMSSDPAFKKLEEFYKQYTQSISKFTKTN